LNPPNSSAFGKFIWHDLAAADSAAALDFYRAVFGWTAVTEYANGGEFIRLQRDGHTVGSMYSLSRREREYGVPSHWTPYVGVECLDAATRRVEAAGGVILVRPFEVDAVARIAVVMDTLGCVLGLWESLAHE
jgi:predicted enzyme related to lactoylglutathione lyase